MPTYSYRCSECDHAFDIQQAFTDDSLTECPKCGGLLRKVFGNIGVSFSGSGFYRNDSRETAKPAKASTDAGGTPSTSGTSSTPSTSEKAKSAPSTTASTTSSSPAKTS